MTSVGAENYYIRTFIQINPSTQPGVVAGTCNPATLEIEFRNGVGSIPVVGNNPSTGEWTV